MDGYIGEIRIWTGNQAPRFWLFCQGQLLKINSNITLYTVLGTQYGGDGISTFGLPDLRSRIPVGVGQGTGLSAYTLGQKGGVETITLQPDNLPKHTHTVPDTGMDCYSGQGNTDIPFNNFPATVPGRKMYTATFSSGTPMPAVKPDKQTSFAGTNTLGSINLIQPVLAINFIICTFGQFAVSTT